MTLSSVLPSSPDAASTVWIWGLTVVLFLSFGMVHLPSESAAPLHDDPAAVVGMTNTLNYTPDTVRVEVGETVRWENSSLIMHTVTADPEEATIDGSVTLPDGAEPFDSGNMDPKATFEHTFETPGTYKYFCIPHEGANMYGWVIVES